MTPSKSENRHYLRPEVTSSHEKLFSAKLKQYTPSLKISWNSVQAFWRNRVRKKRKKKKKPGLPLETEDLNYCINYNWKIMKLLKSRVTSGQAHTKCVPNIIHMHPQMQKGVTWVAALPWHPLSEKAQALKQTSKKEEKNVYLCFSHVYKTCVSSSPTMYPARPFKIIAPRLIWLIKSSLKASLKLRQKSTSSQE